jgi:hypothetical protein
VVVSPVSAAATPRAAPQAFATLHTITAATALAAALLRRQITSSGQAELMRPRPVRVPAPTLGFAGFRFPPDVIMVAVRWYLVGLGNSMQRSDLRSSCAA